MRELTWQEIDDILVGAAALGCGGGGELSEGRQLLRSAYDKGHSVMLAGPDELPGEALVVCPYAVGGLTAGSQDDYRGLELAAENPGVLAVRALGEHMGRSPDALVAGELGGGSIADSFYPAAIMGLPVVDADPVGRAVPEIEHSLFSVGGIPIAPQALVNEVGDTVIITRVADDRRSEALVRALAVASRNAIWVADHALPWSAMRPYLVLGSISRAMGVGAALRKALVEGADPAAAIAAAAGGGILFRGRVVACDWEERDGFGWGETRLMGVGADSGAEYRVWFKNENLMGWRDDLPDVTAPDLIVLVGPDGATISNPHAAMGDHVAVLGLPAADAWRTRGAVEVLGPRHFGFDVDFVPVEARHPWMTEGR